MGTVTERLLVSPHIILAPNVFTFPVGETLHLQRLVCGVLMRMNSPEIRPASYRVEKLLKEKQAC